MTPWEEHKQHQAERAAKLYTLRRIRESLAIEKLEMVYHDITQIKTFTRIDKQGKFIVNMKFVIPVTSAFIKMKIGPFCI